MRRVTCVMILLVGSVVAPVAASADRETGMECRTVIVLYDTPRYPRSFSTMLEEYLALRPAYRFAATSTFSGAGFAARATQAQVRELRKEPSVQAVVTEGSAFTLLAGGPDAKASSWWREFSSRLLLGTGRVVDRFGLAQYRLTARQMARVARVGAIRSITAGLTSWILTPTSGVDAIAKAAALRAEGVSIRHAFPEWFSANLTFEQLVKLGSDPEVKSVEANQIAGWIDTPTPRKPPVQPRACA